jgi:hypothetical protein
MFDYFVLGIALWTPVLVSIEQYRKIISKSNKMKNSQTTFLKPLSYLFILIFPVALVISLTSATMTFDQKNFSIIFGLLFCLAGCIILASGRHVTDDKKAFMKRVWIFVLIVNIIFLFACMMPTMEVFFGWNMPFVEIDNTKLTAFWITVVGTDKQLGFLMLCGMAMMLPSRFIHLAMIKLMSSKKYE